MIAQSRAQEELQRARSRIERLHDVARQLERVGSEDDVYHITVEAAETILSFAMCTLDIVVENRLVTKATSSGLPSGTSYEGDLDSGGLAVETYRTGRTTVFGSLAEVPLANPARTDLRSGISAPIGTDIGVFQAASMEENAFTDEDVRLLELLLGHAAEAIQRLRLAEQLRRQALRDPLTGVYNRRHFNQIIEQEMERSKRYGHSIGFLMIDVDRFKEINDRHGHRVGDQVLQDVAGLLQSQVREIDIVVRYGGDEFLVVLPETRGEAEAVRQRILEEAARRNEAGRVFGFPVTLSVGSAHWSPESEQAMEEVLAEADARMYEAKRRRQEAAEE
jgi:diguanylate cyclase (GGDEF)-like protein